MTAITYRRATAHDSAILTELRLLLLHEVRGKDDDQTTAQLRQNILEYYPSAIVAGAYVGFIAYANGEVAGTGGMAIRQQPPSYKYTNGKLAYIMNMYTLPQYRGLGIGTAILEKLLDTAAETDIQKIELHASPDGEPLYRRLGFTESKTPVLEKQKTA